MTFKQQGLTIRDVKTQAKNKKVRVQRDNVSENHSDKTAASFLSVVEPSFSKFSTNSEDTKKHQPPVSRKQTENSANSLPHFLMFSDKPVKLKAESKPKM